MTREHYENNKYNRKYKIKRLDNLIEETI